MFESISSLVVRFVDKFVFKCDGCLEISVFF